jgi:hypothetical protein
LLTNRAVQFAVFVTALGLAAGVALVKYARRGLTTTPSFSARREIDDADAFLEDVMRSDWDDDQKRDLVIAFNEIRLLPTR